MHTVDTDIVELTLLEAVLHLRVLRVDVPDELAVLRVGFPLFFAIEDGDIAARYGNA